MNIKRILFSRIRKNQTEPEWVAERRKTCAPCEFNTKNMEKISHKQKVYRFFSNLLTIIMTGKKNGDDSECSLCECTLEYKIPDPDESCKAHKWKQ